MFQVVAIFQTVLLHLVPSIAMAPHAVEAQYFQNTDSVLPQARSRPLKVIIVGAGVAGLSAAIGLRRAGHEVQVGLDSI